MKKLLKFTVLNPYWIPLVCIVLWGIQLVITGNDLEMIFHKLAFYFPAIAMLSMISAHINLLISISEGGLVNLKARLYDFVHWLMLIAMNIGVWLIGGSTIWWFILKLALLAIIGWQIGVGIKMKLKLTHDEKIYGLMTAICALILGLVTGYIRTIDQTRLGWGWTFEAITAVIATLIVIKWMWHDIHTISEKVSGYPRVFFLKGLLNNTLVLVFWIHVMTWQGNQFSDSWSWIDNFRLSFNVIIGNIIFWVYYSMYEYYRKKQS